MCSLVKNLRFVGKYQIVSLSEKQNYFLWPFFHQQIGSRCFAAVKKRFYKNVTLTENNGTFEVNLDQRKIKTPLGNVLQIPNGLLAAAVATEWETQDKTIELHNMHLTGLCNTVIDNPNKKTKENLVECALEYLENDTLCYRVEEPPELLLAQTEKWDPVIRWFEERYRISVHPTSSVNLTVIPDETRNLLHRHLLSYNSWVLQGILFAAENLKSLILAFAAVDHLKNIETVVFLSRLEMEFQISKWGNVEWSHDVDLFQLRLRVAAGILFANLNSENTSIQKKRSVT